jgi:cytoskeletal protein CcmA (bactofilin family)
MTVVAKATVFSGELSGASPVRIEGAVKGSISLTAAVEVAEGATVEADITATRVAVSGTVIGSISASEMVSVESSGLVRGDVTSPALQVVEGAILDGRVTMGGGRPSPPSS